jgi:hypothetical protein
MLACDRAFLSFIDSRHQFICAEMTRNQPLTRVNLKEPLLLGASCNPLHWGDCPYTMSVFQGKPVTLPASPYIVADRSFFYIEDFREVPAFVERPYVAGYPFMVSNIEVPLTSLSGHILGSYCLVDDKPRDFLKPESLRIIRGVTSAISSYLDLKRVEGSRTRSQNMMDGLQKFIASERHVSNTEHSGAEPNEAQPGPFDIGVFNASPQLN